MIIELAILGLLLTVYSLSVQYNSRKKSYKAFCDLHKNISCTKAFTSKYARTFGIYTTWFGLAYYTLIIIFLEQPYLIWFLSIFAAIRSAQLAYDSYVKMKNFCLVCSATYIVNFALLFATSATIF